MTSPRDATAVDVLAPAAALPGVAEAAAEARDAVDGLLRHRVLRRRTAEVAAEAGLRGARASAALEGTDVALERLRSALVDGTPLDPRLAGSIRVAAELAGLAPAWRTAPRQALARLHAVAARDLVGAASLGRPRGGGDVPDPLGLGAPLPPAVVSARLDALAEALATPTQAPAAVVAAVVHGELLTLRPFGVADGLVARAAARLVLRERGLDPALLCVPEAGHLEGGAERYAEAARGYAEGSAAGVGRWVVHCAQALRFGAQEGRAICEGLARTG